MLALLSRTPKSQWKQARANVSFHVSIKIPDCVFIIEQNPLIALTTEIILNWLSSCQHDMILQPSMLDTVGLKWWRYVWEKYLWMYWRIKSGMSKDVKNIPIVRESRREGEEVRQCCQQTDRICGCYSNMEPLPCSQQGSHKMVMTSLPWKHWHFYLGPSLLRGKSRL